MGHMKYYWCLYYTPSRNKYFEVVKTTHPFKRGNLVPDWVLMNWKTVDVEDYNLWVDLMESNGDLVEPVDTTHVMD